MALFGINQRSKAIKKKEKIVNENLKRKRIFLEQDDFDIKSILYEKEETPVKPSKQLEQETASPSKVKANL